MSGWRWAWWRSAKDTEAEQVPDESDTAGSGHHHRGKDKGLYCPDCGSRIEPHEAYCPECHGVLKPW